MVRGILTLALLCAIARPAHAGSDYRWHDRFFFGIGAGGVDTSTIDPAGGRELTFAYDVSYWHNDFFAMRAGIELSPYADDWGLDVFGAVPLRYVQLYAGPHLGLRNTRNVSNGVEGQLHLVIGVQGYLGRNGRLFLQWEDPPVDELRLGDQHADVVMAGLRWSPDVFHSARPTFKIDAVWLSMTLSLAVWGIASASQ